MTQRRNWIKIYVDQCLRGTMMKELEYDERWAWIGILLLAGDSPFEGKVAISETIGYTDDQIAGLLEMPVDIYLKAKAKMIEHDKIAIDGNGIIKIVNWRKYQSEYGRLKKYREPHRSTPKGTEKSTPNSHTREGEGDRDKEREKERDIKEEIYALLIPTKGLGPDKTEKLTDFIVDELMPEFPEIDAIDQVKKKVIWWRDKPLTKESRPHSQMRTWFKKAQSWIEEAKAQDQVGSPRAKSKKPKPAWMVESEKMVDEAEKKVLAENPGKRGPEIDRLVREARGKASQEFWKKQKEK